MCSDNSKLISCGGDRQIFYWDVSTGRVIRKFRGHDGEVCCRFVMFFGFTMRLEVLVFEVLFWRN